MAGRSYKDPYWDGIEAPIEAELKLPKGTLRAIRHYGERSNSDQVSPVGARTVYQIMPRTRDLFRQTYGVDAFADDHQAAKTAALHLRDDLKKHGSLDQAVIRYIGGPNKRMWGKQTRAYVKRVMKGMGLSVSLPLSGEIGAAAAAPAASAPLEPATDWKGMDWMNTRPGDRKARPARPHVNSHQSEAKRADKLTNMAAGANARQPTNTDTVDRTVDMRDVDRVELNGIVQKDYEDSVTTLDRIGASFSDNSLTAAIWRRLEQQNFRRDPEYVKYREKNLTDILAFAKDSDEEDWLLEASSAEELKAIQGRIEARRARRDLYQGSGVSTAGSVTYSLLGGVLDPVGWMAGAGFGKVAQLGGIGGRTLLASGRTLPGIASLAVENAASNVAITAAMDATGDHYSRNDYASAAAFGGIFGAASSVLNLPGRKTPDTSVEDHFIGAHETAKQYRLSALDAAQSRLGASANEDAVAREAARAATGTDLNTVLDNLAPADDRFMFLSPDSTITNDRTLKAKVEGAHGLDIIADEGERGLIAEKIARSNRMVASVDLKAYNTALENVGGESSSTALLNGKSNVSKAVSLSLLESPTGAGGRRRTAALSQHMRDKAYMEELRGFDRDYAMFRDTLGKSWVGDLTNGDARRQFNRRVASEVRRRQGGKIGDGFDDSVHVRNAADRLYRGFELMRVDQQKVGTLGAANLPETAWGYLPQKLVGAKVIDLHRNDRASFNAVRNVLSGQFQDLNGFDEKFSTRLADRYLDEAMHRATKGYDVPVHIYSGEAAEIIDAAIDGMKLNAEEAKAIKDSYARGGATHTRKRLRLNTEEVLPNGQTLGDLYNNDVLALYRGYARRVSGEVALAQHGVMGKKGLDTLRQAIVYSGGEQREIEAFDQIAAEFLNTPYGSHNHNYMDNARLATTLARNGGMGFTQITEYSNGLAALGVKQVLSAMADAPRLFGEIRKLIDGEEVDGLLNSIEAYTGDLGIDKYDMSRMFDVPDNEVQSFGSEQLGLTTRLLRAGAHGQAVLSGHRVIHAIQVRGLSEQIVRKALGMVRQGKADAHLDDMGIGPQLRQRLAANLDRVATFDHKGKLQKLDIEAGDLTPGEKLELSQAIMRGANQIIQGTFIGETGPWAHHGLLKLLLQFRTFGVTSIEKQWGRSMVRNGGGTGGAIRSFATLIGAMSFGLPIYAAKLQTKMIGMGEAERDEYWDKHTTAMAMGRAVLQYTSMSGLSSDFLEGFGSFAGGLGFELEEGGTMARGGYSGKVSMGTLVPSLGMVEDTLTAASNLRDRDGTINERSMAKLGRMLPGSTLPFVQPAINAITPDK